MYSKSRQSKGSSLSFFPSASSPLDFFSDNRSKIETLQQSRSKSNLYIQKALDEENVVEQLVFSLVHCATLAYEKKGVGCKSELADLYRNRMN
jgi:hypothetical protein